MEPVDVQNVCSYLISAESKSDLYIVVIIIIIICFFIILFTTMFTDIWFIWLFSTFICGMVDFYSWFRFYDAVTGFTVQPSDLLSISLLLWIITCAFCTKQSSSMLDQLILLDLSLTLILEFNFLVQDSQHWCWLSMDSWWYDALLSHWQLETLWG